MDHSINDSLELLGVAETMVYPRGTELDSKSHDFLISGQMLYPVT